MVIVWRNLPAYRVAFYEGLKRTLSDDGITLRLLIGQPSQADVRRGDQATLGWEQRVETRRVRFGHQEFLWQPIARHLRPGDFVIAEQGTKNLVNYWLHLQRRRQALALAYWGHGANLQARPNDLPRRASETLKRALAKNVDWWFAYTTKSVDIVTSLGFPRERVTDVQNATDTRRLSADLASVSPEECADLRSRLRLRSDHVGLFLGGLYPDKNLAFVVAAAQEVRKQIPDFELCIAGDGIEAPRVQSAAAMHPWIHWLGPVFGHDKSVLLRVADAMLVPQAAGLVMLDAFAAGLPPVVIHGALHGPEEAYLEPGVNSVMVGSGATASAYAEAASRLLSDPPHLERLRTACIESSKRYSMEEMIARFADGVRRGLESTSARAGRS